MIKKPDETGFFYLVEKRTSVPYVPSLRHATIDTNHGKRSDFFEEKAYEMAGFLHYADGTLYRSAVIK